MTWLDLPPDSLFGISNLPYGVFSAGNRRRPGPGMPPGPGVRRVGVRIGDSVLDLAQVLDDPVFGQPSLNAFMAQGRIRWSDARARITELLTAERHRRVVEASLYPLSGVRLHLPFTPGDYVDFFGNEYHAANAGRIFRPGAEPLAPNWKYLPVGYHGRSGTIVVSGTPVTRPRGQRKEPQDRVIGAGLEGGGDLTLARAAAHQRGITPGTESERQCVEQDRFSGAGLAGQRAQSLTEFEIEPVN